MYTLRISLIALLSIVLYSCSEEEPPVVIVEPIDLGCNIDEPLTLTDNPDAPVDYIVNCRLDVYDALSIEPGVVIHFGNDASLYIREDGRIEAQGTNVAPVVFAGEIAQAGFWRGIYSASSDLRNTLNYCHILDAGSSSHNGSAVNSGIRLPADARMKITNCYFDRTSGNAIYGTWSAEDDQLTGFAENSFGPDISSYPISIPANLVHHIDGQSTFSHTYGVNATHATSLLGTHQWKALNTIIRINKEVTFGSAGVEGELIIDPGCTIHFGGDEGFVISESGTIQCGQLGAAPVTIEGEVDQSGSWQGIYVGSNFLDNKIHNTVIRNAGSSPQDGSSVRAAVRVQWESYLDLNEVEITGTDGCAIYEYVLATITQNAVSYSGNSEDYCTD